jgi:hypothetical protein
MWPHLLVAPLIPEIDLALKCILGTTEYSFQPFVLYIYLTRQMLRLAPCSMISFSLHTIPALRSDDPIVELPE